MKYHGTGRTVETGDLVQVVEPGHRFQFWLGRVRKLGTPTERHLIVRFGSNDEATLTCCKVQWVGKPRTK